MIRDFSKDELETTESARDTELTIQGGTLVALGCGLLALCTVCFTIGYFVGHRGSPGPATAFLPASSLKPPPIPTGSGAKPGAAGQQQAKPPAVAAADVSTDQPGAASSPIAAQTSALTGNAGTSQPQLKETADSPVHPALAGTTSGTQPAPPLQVQPAIAKVQGWMVQIAAVSQSEDAEVLVNALRKRGYTVAARRETGDSLIHVQTGPFVNRNDANAMRQKLLNDGYNAIVE